MLQLDEAEAAHLRQQLCGDGLWGRWLLGLLRALLLILETLLHLELCQVLLLLLMLLLLHESLLSHLGRRQVYGRWHSALLLK